MDKRRILSFTSYYLPGYKNGGPVSSLRNMCEALFASYEFSVITRDRDRGDINPYSDINYDRWHSISGARIWYLRSPHWAPWNIRRVIKATKPDLLYFHSFFDPALTIMPLVLRRLGLISNSIPVLLAPRGEFSPGAISIKRAKKHIYIRAAKFLGIYRGIVWHSTSQEEHAYLAKWWGADARIVMAPNLPMKRLQGSPARTNPKQENSLRLSFLSRISPKKNLDGALKALATINAEIRFDIHGPKEDEEYWRKCEEIIKSLPKNVTVTYHGPLSPEEVIPALSRSDVFFFPTRGENFGHVILEALLAGCPVILSDQTPWRNLSAIHVGFDLALDKPARFKEAIERFAAMDEKEFNVWSECAYAHGVQYSEKPDLLSSTRELLNGAMKQ